MRNARRVLLIVAWTAMAVLCFLDLDTPGDYTGFVAFGRAVNDGVLVYAPDAQARYLDAGGQHWATWPPGFAPLASVLARFDAVAHAPAVILFQLLNLAALAMTAFVAAEWLTGRRPGAPEPERRLAWDAPVIAVAILVPIRLVVSNFEHAQVNLLVLGLVLLGFRMVERRPASGGLLFGLGSALKATPILLLPWLVWRRRWRALGAALLGVLFAWLVLPAAVLGFEQVLPWWRAWLEALPLAGAQENWMNQSLRSIAVLRLGPETGLRVWVAGTAALALAILVAFGRPFLDVGRRRAGAEVAVLLVAITVVSPVAWKAHYATLVPLAATVFVLAHRAGGVRGRLGLGVLGVTAAGINLTSSDLVGRSAAVFLQERGVVLWAALLLLATALTLLSAAEEGTGARSGARDPGAAAEGAPTSRTRIP